jgi:hypothetical protein
LGAVEGRRRDERPLMRCRRPRCRRDLRSFCSRSEPRTPEGGGGQPQDRAICARDGDTVRVPASLRTPSDRA